MKKVLVVSNINAGRKKAIKYRKLVHKFLFEKQIDFCFINIDEINNLNIEPYDTIIVMGGDGSVNKVLPYLNNRKLGIIPTGTANLLAARLGIKNINEAIKIIDKEQTTSIDIISVNERPCILRCGFGYDANIIGKTPQSLKNKFGYFSYFLSGILHTLRLEQKEYSIEIDGVDYNENCSCLIIANAGNMYKNLFKLDINGSLTDGLFDIFILNTKNPIIFFIEFIKIGLNVKNTNKFVKYLKASDLKIKNNYCLSHIDGEKIKFSKDINFKISDKKINIFCP